MILWCDGAHAPDENMRRDQALLAALDGAERGDTHAAAVLRLFRFEPHGITLGRSQDPSQALDLDRCRLGGVPWAVRPTGGRAIFHAEEWTWSLAAAIADPEWGGTLSQAYERAVTLVLRSLVRLGVPAALAARSERGARAAAATGRERSEAALPLPRTAGPGLRNPAAAACFAATARHEIVLGGRKLVGCAQRRGARALLQQGSVLLGPGHERLADYLRIPDEARTAARTTLAASATHAGLWLGPHPPLSRWADAVRAELPPGTARFEGAAGVHLLTLAETASYTDRS